MKKIVLLALVLVLLSTAVVWGFIRPSVTHINASNSSCEGKFVFASSKTIWVPDNFTSIQEAINNASDGDTIFVRADTYYEHLDIGKSISLIGENKENTIIDGSRNGTVISVTADYVSISGLTIQNGYHIPHVTYGIKVGEWNDGCNNVTVSGNIISNNDQGIFLYYSNNDIVTNNIIFNNYRGISIVLSHNNYIEGNSLFNNEAGVVIGSDANSNAIRDNEICNNSFCGVQVGWSSGNEIIRNTLSLNNEAGIRLDASRNNNIIGNTITSSNRDGIVLFGSDTNTIVRNELIQSKWNGIAVWYSNGNVIYHNNFQDNTKQAASYSGSTNIWHNGYPSGGNYWSDYAVDFYSGSGQNVTGSDGIEDAPYNIDVHNQDRYPLMGPINDFDAGKFNNITYCVDVISNSTVSDFYFSEDDKLISFNVGGLDDTIGFCRVAIPNELLWCDNPEQWQVWVNNTLIEDRKTMEDTNYTYIYFTYNHSIQEVQIKGIHVISEFSMWTSESILATEVFYGDGCELFEEGIYVIATETNPVEMYRDYTFINDYYRMLKEHVTTEASIEDFVSILVSRGICPTGGYGLKIRSIEKIDYAFVLSADFVDAGPEVIVPLCITNPVALIPIGNLPAGEYSITLYIDKYMVHCFDGTWYREYIGTETWTATFNCSAGWITVTGFEVEMSIENKTTALGEKISMFMVALVGTESSSSQIFDIHLYNSNYSLFSRWSQGKAFLCVWTHVDPGYNETLRWTLYRYVWIRNYFPPPPGNYYLVGALMGNGEIRDVTPAILIKIDDSTITPIAEGAQPPLLELKTDKTGYVLGENVTITLTNIGITYVRIGGYPCVEIFTYPDLEPVWPDVFAWLAWGLAPGESETWIWDQYISSAQKYAEPGVYIVEFISHEPIPDPVVFEILPPDTSVPEFPTWTSMLLILIVLTVAVVIYKRRLLKTPIR